LSGYALLARESVLLAGRIECQPRLCAVLVNRKSLLSVWLPPKCARAPRVLHPRRPAMDYLPCNLTLSGGKILLLFALTIAPPRYKQMAASQRNGDVFVPIPRTRLANAFPRSGPRCRFAWPGWGLHQHNEPAPSYEKHLGSVDDRYHAHSRWRHTSERQDQS
jgi:hypothetical protein